MEIVEPNLDELLDGPDIDQAVHHALGWHHGVERRVGEHQAAAVVVEAVFALELAQ